MTAAGMRSAVLEGKPVLESNYSIGGGGMGRGGSHYIYVYSYFSKVAVVVVGLQLCPC